MNPFAVFIRRPVATTLLAVAALLLGTVAYTRLPIASLPPVERPTISVTAFLPGASPDTVATSLAQPLERQLGTIPGIVEMASFSATGGAQIIIQFALDQDIDAAASAVQAAINAAGPYLPKDLPQPPRYWKSNTSGMAVIALALTSETFDPGEVYDFADSIVSQQLARIPGVARVVINGAERGAVRIQALPARLAEMGLSLENVREAVTAASANRPKGSVNAAGRSYTIAANDQLLKADDYRNIVVAWRNHAPVFLADVAAVSDDVMNNKLAGWYNLERGVIVYVYKQMDANVVETVDAVKALLPQMEHWIPPAVKVRVVFDRTLLIRSSIAEVQLTIAIAIALVMLVIALFIKRLWATMIPAVTIPVALAATLAFMDACGLTLDNLSLMALTIGIGFIVDDAVIVVENVLRRVEDGAAPAVAAGESTAHIGFTIVAISAALVAAMIPVLFMPDVVGRYFREFGVSLVALLVVSALVSLTLTPMLCSRLPARTAATGRGGKRLAVWYARSLRLGLRHRGISLGLTIAVMAASLWLYGGLPKGFMPTQDTGIITARTITTPNVSFAAMEEIQRAVAAAVLRDPAVDGLTSFIGTNNGRVLSSGNLLISLKPPEERRMSVRQVIGRLRQRVAAVPGARTFFTPWQDLSLGAQSSIARYQYTLIASDPDELARWGDIMRRRMARMREIIDVVVDNDYGQGLGAQLAIDRVRAAAFGVTAAEIDNVLYDAFGERLTTTIYFPHNFTRVVLEVDPSEQTDPAVELGVGVVQRSKKK